MFHSIDDDDDDDDHALLANAIVAFKLAIYTHLPY